MLSGMASQRLQEITAALFLAIYRNQLAHSPRCRPRASAGRCQAHDTPAIGHPKDILPPVLDEPVQQEKRKGKGWESTGSGLRKRLRDTASPYHPLGVPETHESDHID